MSNYFRDELTDVTNEDAANNRVCNNKATTSKYLEYKKKVIWRKPDNDSALNTEVVVSLKYLSNFWRSSDLPLINC